MRPINQPLVHTADESFAEFERRRWALRATTAARPPPPPRAGNGADKGTPGEGPDDAAMYAQNGEAAPELSCQVKRRRSDDGERTKRARAAAERGCESDGGLPSSDQPPAHHHHHHHHKKAARPPGDEGPPKGDLHGVCTLEEGSLKLKISLHRPHAAVTPEGDGLSAGKPDGDRTASRPQSPLSLSKPGAQAAEESQLPSEARDAVAQQPNSASSASYSAVQDMECVPRGEDCDDDKTSDAALLTRATPAPVVVRKVEVPASYKAALEPSTKDTLCTAPLNTSSPLQSNVVKSDVQDVGSPQPLTTNNNATDTSLASLAKTSIPKIPPCEPCHDSIQSTDTPVTFTHPKEPAGTNNHGSSSSGARPRKSMTPGHYVPYEAQQNRRRLIQDTSKLRRKGRGHADLPATVDSAAKAPHSFHHVHMSVGQNGGRGFVNHNSIMDHPSVHARMFPPPESPPTKLAALLNSSRPPATSAAGKQQHRPAGPSKAGTSSGEHQPLDLSRAMPRRSVPAPKLSCLDQMPGNYVPPIAVFYMRPGSRQRLDGIIRKLWAKHNSLLRGRPRP